MAQRSKSSQRWLQEHFKDPYVQEAQRQGYRSRAVFKLQQLDEKYALFKPGMRVLDLGAAPGGWSQYAGQRLGAKGQVIASDILPMEALEGVTFIQGDFQQESVMQQILAALQGQPVDLVISDMAPNISGVASVDQARSMYLLDLALDMALKVLPAGGIFLCKLFQGEGSDAFIAELKQEFGKVLVRKPDASRSRSREVYALARDRKLA